MIRAVASLLFLPCLSMTQLTAAETPSLIVEQLTDGVFVFRPTDEAFALWRSISNSGAAVLDDGALIYDSHWTPALAEKALKLLRQHTAAPIRTTGPSTRITTKASRSSS